MKSNAEALASIPMIHSIKEPARSHIIQIIEDISQAVTVPADTMLIRLGDDMQHTGYAILTGRVKIQGDQTEPIFVSAPELLGEMQQFNQTMERMATVVVIEEAKVLRFKWHDFVSTIQNSAIISKKQRKEIQHVITEHAEKRLKELETHDT